MRDALGFNPWEKQVEIAYSVRDTKETFVQSCNGAGKTVLSAALCLWYGLTRRSIVITTAPTFRQVKDLLWANIRAMVSRAKVPLGVEPLQTRIQLADDWYITGLSTNDPSKFQGYHGNVFIVVDEACGLSGPQADEIWRAIQGNLTGDGARLLAIGNPTDPTTEFRRRCEAPRRGSRNVIKISAFDTPNVKLGREVLKGGVTREWVEEQRATYGEDSPFWKARVLGEFPLEVDDSLYPIAWLERAFTYDAEEFGELANGEVHVGFDIAASGADKSALCVRDGGRVLQIHGWQAIDTTRLVDELYRWVDRYNPNSVYIDAVGVGKPIYDEAKKRKRMDPRHRSLSVLPFYAQGNSSRPDLYVNRKAEAYLHLRELLRTGKIDLSAIGGDMRQELEKQASSIRYTIDPQGRWQIENKMTMRRRVGFSPDELEALIMAFYGGRKRRAHLDTTAAFAYVSAENESVDTDTGDFVEAFEYDIDKYTKEDAIWRKMTQTRG